jgi:two-component system, LytTR family, sensor kinase
MVQTADNSDRFALFGVSAQSIIAAFAVWTVLGLSFAFRSYVWGVQNNVSFPLWAQIGQTLTDFYLYALAAPLIFRLGKRFPLEFGRLAVCLPFHLAASVLFAVLIIVTSLFTVRLLGLNVCTECPAMIDLLPIYLTNPIFFHQGILAYWGIAAVGQGLRYYREAQNEKVRVSELSARLSAAQLAALKMQIQPHFLFNTLNSIAALIQEDKDAAELMITKLSDFLRMTLHSSGAPVVTVKEEFYFLKTYLEIEKVRFAERLSVKFVHNAEVLPAKIPNLLLQPLVENSIRHGINSRKESGFIRISAVRVENRLHIEISDNGKILEKNLNSSATGGLGLKNTAERLKQIYGADYKFKIAGNSGGGTTVEINIPFVI